MHAFKLFSYLILTSLVASLPSSTSDTLALDDTVPADGAADIVHGQCTFRATVRNFCDPNSHLPLWAISLQGIKNPNGNQIQGKRPLSHWQGRRLESFVVMAKAQMRIR